MAFLENFSRGYPQVVSECESFIITGNRVNSYNIEVSTSFMKSSELLCFEFQLMQIRRIK